MSSSPGMIRWATSAKRPMAGAMASMNTGAVTTSTDAREQERGQEEPAREVCAQPAHRGAKVSRRGGTAASLGRREGRPGGGCRRLDGMQTRMILSKLAILMPPRPRRSCSPPPLALARCGGAARARRAAHGRGDDDPGGRPHARGRRRPRRRRRLLPANADPHDYEVRPDDVKALAGADLVVRSGGDLDDWLDGAIESSGTDAPTLTLIDHVDAPRATTRPDPHWWQDPRNAVRAVAAIEAALAQADPAAPRPTSAPPRAYTGRHRRARRGGRRPAWTGSPPEQRKLVTTHDALGYYARRYGLEVIGAVIPSLSTQAQASAGEVTRAGRDDRRGASRRSSPRARSTRSSSRSWPTRPARASGKALWADTLGPAGSDGATYLGSIAANTRAIADGLSGGAVRCDLPG